MGLLTQALTNATDAEKQIGALSGLPDAAQSVQRDSAAVIGRTVPDVQRLQAAVNAFGAKASSQLADALGVLGRSDAIAALKPIVTQMQSEATTLQTTVTAVTQGIAGSSQQVFGYQTQLATIASQLGNQASQLQGQLNNARDEEDAAHKRYLYLLALGPFGLVGLAVALGLYLKWKSDADGYARDASALSAQITRLNMMIAAIQQLGGDFRDLSNKIQAVKNSVGFLAGDIQEILDDVGKGGTSITALKVYLTAAQSEVTTLRADAS